MRRTSLSGVTWDDEEKASNDEFDWYVGCHAGVSSINEIHASEDEDYEYSWIPSSSNSWVRQPKDSKIPPSETTSLSQKYLYSGYKPSEYKKETTDKVFLYDNSPGSLIKTIMKRDGFIKTAKTLPKYRLIDINNGEFPAMSEPGDTTVTGELYNAVPRTLKFLDSVLDKFHREIISLEDGTRAYAYVMPSFRTPPVETKIPSGNWLEWKRSERQRKRKFKEEKTALEFKEKENFKKFFNASSEKNSEDNNISNKKRIHISCIKSIDLRNFCHQNNFNTERLSDREVRVECIRKFGNYYLVDA